MSHRAESPVTVRELVSIALEETINAARDKAALNWLDSYEAYKEGAKDMYYNLYGKLERPSPPASV